MKRGGSFLLEPVVGSIFTRERFSEEQKEIDRMVRDFARERIRPHREELATLNRELSLRLLREAAEMGLTAIDIPERFGGLEQTKTTAALVNEALTSGGSADWLVTYSVHVGIGTLPIVYFGSESQKEKYLPKAASVEMLCAYALTEPNAGSDAMNIKTTAQLSEDGQSYVLNGAKQYITNGGMADLFIVFASIEGKGITAFIVESGSEGLGIGAEEHKMGIKGSSTVALTLENVRVPSENLLGTIGHGHHIALNILNVGRFKLGAADLGACKSCVTQAASYALERHQFGQPIAFFQAIRKKLADMIVRSYTLDSVIYRTVGLMDERIAGLDSKEPGYNRDVMAALEEYAIEASISKILGSETLFRIADHGIQIYGGYGVAEDYPMAAVFRNCRVDRIWEGTNEINRMVIYGYYLKKSLMEELPVRDAEKSGGSEEPGEVGPLKWEVRSLGLARRLAVRCLHEAISLFGQDLRNEQFVGEDLADLIIGYYAAASGVNRILQLDKQTRGDRPYRALARLIVAGYLEEAWRLYYRLRPCLFSDGYARRFVDALDREIEQMHPPFNPVNEVQVLTDDLYRHGQYRFE